MVKLAVGGLRLLWHPTPSRLAESVDALDSLDLTYAEVGAATCPAALPSGYHHIDHSTVVGTGQRTFDLLADAVLSWNLQRTAGFIVATTHERVTIGATVLNCLGAPFGLLAPCRVVDLIQDERQHGFSYGTLPGHPLRGEERFTVELDEAGRVVLRIRSFSTPTGLPGIAPALARAGQRAVNRRYAKAACRIVVPPGAHPTLPQPPTQPD